MLAANPVIGVFGVITGVPLQPMNERFGVALDDLVGVDEIEVDIT